MKYVMMTLGVALVITNMPPLIRNEPTAPLHMLVVALGIGLFFWWLEQ